ncbi:MAG: hypothetical protein GY756_20310 [bacterium]|nr:hypothetical protein [bacterium]
MEYLGLILSLICGIIASVVAYNKHRSAIGWFFGGFFLGIIGIVIVSVLKDPIEEQRLKDEADQENRRLREQLNQEKVKNEVFREHTYKRLDAHDSHLENKKKNGLLPESKVN